jgi:CRP-like cAMP-binding protein
MMARLRLSISCRRLQEGEHMFREGEVADTFYFVLSGQVKLYRLSSAGNEKVIEIIRPGQTFAEALMFRDRPCYPVNAQALSDSLLLAVTNQGMLELLSQSTPLAFQVMAALSIRLHGLLNEIDSLTLQNATLRVVNYLLYLMPEGSGEEGEVELPAAKNIIASRLSIQPETLSRILATLSRQGLIAVNGLNIDIRDVAALRTYLG